MINEHQKNKEKVCVELKVVEDGQDVYQLLMYMEATIETWDTLFNA